MDIELDFRDVARRRPKTDYDGQCPHITDCFTWQSSDGPVPTCQMGDWHLINAYIKSARNAEDYELSEEVRDDFEVSALGLGDEIDARDLWREVRMRW